MSIDEIASVQVESRTEAGSAQDAPPATTALREVTQDTVLVNDITPMTDEAAAEGVETCHETKLRKQSKVTETSVLNPPDNFAYVEDGLFRSGQPTDLNFPFLQRLKLKGLIWLAPEEPNTHFRDFMHEESITLHHIGVMEASDAWDPITEAVVLKALNIMLQPSAYPLMVMSNLGTHRTGTVIGCLRKLQRWTLASIFEEYRRHAGANARLNNEQFIELFDTDLVAIPRLPTATTATEGA